MWEPSWVPGGQTGMTKLIVALRHFAKAPKNHTNERPFLKTLQSSYHKHFNTVRERSDRLRLYQTKCNSV